MGETSTALRLLRAHLQAASALLDALVDAPPVPEPVEEPTVKCPKCSETREEKLEETPFAGEDGVLIRRVTCLTCGESFRTEGANG